MEWTKVSLISSLIITPVAKQDSPRESKADLKNLSSKKSQQKASGAGVGAETGAGDGAGVGVKEIMTGKVKVGGRGILTTPPPHMRLDFEKRSGVVDDNDDAYLNTPHDGAGAALDGVGAVGLKIAKDDWKSLIAHYQRRGKGEGKGRRARAPRRRPYHKNPATCAA